MLASVTHELAPFDAATACRALGRLAPLRKILAGGRGRKPSNLDALSLLFSKFSVMAADLADLVAEIDANPIIAGPSGAIAVDAIVVSRATKENK
jgi:hypothetical protein